MDLENEDLGLDSEQFSLEDILSEYLTDETPTELSELEQQSRSILLEALGDTIATSVEPEENELSEAELQPVRVEVEKEPKVQIIDFSKKEEEIKKEETAEAELAVKTEAKEAETDDIATKVEDIVSPKTENEAYASSDFNKAEEEKNVREAVRRTRPPRKKSFAETIMLPVLAVLASVAEKRHNIKLPDPYAIEVDEGEEMPANKARKLYENQLRSFDLRSKIALGLCILLSYITFAFTGFLPLGGALATSTAVCALVSLIILLSVVLAGLDVFTNGIKTLIEGRGSLESLVSLSCIFSALDAVFVASGVLNYGIPLSAVSAWSMFFAIYSNRSSCVAMLSNVDVILNSRKTPMAVTAQKLEEDKASCIVKSEIPIKNFIRRSECADICEISYIVALPFILAVALVLSIVVAINTEAGAFFHALSALIAVSASFISLISFTKPFADLALRLKRSGAALAGYAGCEDIGEAGRFVILDKDLFPKGTMKVDGAKLFGNDGNEKTISYTASVLSAAGVGIAHVFVRAAEEKNYALGRVENLVTEEGGMTAEVNGNIVSVGSLSYMHLKKIQVPTKYSTHTSIYTVINGNLSAAFIINYRATRTVKYALDMLLKDVGLPVFAIRDFNITPVLIRRKFQVSTDDFEFPSCEERFRISGSAHDEKAPISAIFAKAGMGPMAELMIGARRLFKTSRILLALSFVSIAVGMGLVVWLCGGDLPSISLASRILLYMLAITAPVLGVLYRLK